MATQDTAGKTRPRRRKATEKEQEARQLRSAEMQMLAMHLASELGRKLNVGPRFFETGMGHTFYQGTMPMLVREVKRLADAVEVVGGELGELRAEMGARRDAGRDHVDREA